MEIDLSLLHSQTIDSIDITNKYSLPSTYFHNYDEVISIDDIQVNGSIYLDEEENDHIKCSIEGKMILKDSVSLEPVNYPYLIEIDDILEENCKKNENTLDIFSYLWENIVLEIPLQFTKVTDLSKFHGDGWKLISEEENTIKNNPFNDLLKDFKEE